MLSRLLIATLNDAARRPCADYARAVKQKKEGTIMVVRRKLQKIVILLLSTILLSLIGYSYFIKFTEDSVSSRVEGVDICNFKMYMKFQDKWCLKYQVEFMYNDVTYKASVEDRYGRKSATKNEVDIYFSKYIPSLSATIYPYKERVNDFIFWCVVISLFLTNLLIIHYKSNRNIQESNSVSNAAGVCSSNSRRGGSNSILVDPLMSSITVIIFVVFIAYHFTKNA